MGNPKQKWTSEEEEALRAGVAKHGTGKWKNIQRDPEFNHLLFSRSNIDLKDKWRNMSVSNNPGGGPRDKSRTPKPKANSEVPAIPLSNPQTSASASAVTVTHDSSADIVMEDSSRSLVDGKIAPRYNAMIFEALSTLKDPNGLDTSTIVNFVEQRHEGPVPQNFRRMLTSRLRRLVQQEKLEKAQNGFYRIKKEEPFSGTKTPPPKQKDIRPKQVSVTTTPQYSSETEEDAAIAAAYKIAEAENKAHVAAEAVKEAERVSKMAEDTDSLLQLATEIFDRCSRGEIVLMA